MNFWDKMNAAYYDMVDLKVSLGYCRDTYKPSQVLPFVEYCANKFPNAEEITKEMLDSWLVLPDEILLCPSICEMDVTGTSASANYVPKARRRL